MAHAVFGIACMALLNKVSERESSVLWHYELSQATLMYITLLYSGPITRHQKISHGITRSNGPHAWAQNIVRVPERRFHLLALTYINKLALNQAILVLCVLPLFYSTVAVGKPFIYVCICPVLNKVSLWKALFESPIPFLVTHQLLPKWFPFHTH